MCILSSVGRNGANDRNDIKTIQILLNMSRMNLVPLCPLAEDGVVGNKTIHAIEEYQRRVDHLTQPSGRIDPGCTALRKLQESLPPGFSQEKLAAIMINGRRADVAKYFKPLDSAMKKYGINTPLRMAHFLAQLAHESMDLRYSEEIASGDAYEGRADLGNTYVGDGKRFKGRGLIQLTGRSNYEKYGAMSGKDFTIDANIALVATDPYTAVDVSCWFWDKGALNRLADRDDIMAVTKRINGGYNGLEDRRRKLDRAKFFLGR